MTGREALAFRLCLLAIALYLLDDAFVHPEPGTGAGDHLAGGLVPPAILALLAAGVPRLRRAGAGAAVALALGLGTLAAGIAVPVRHVTLQGPSGDDWTGMLALLAGAVLVVLGARLLWTTRRLDTPHWRRYLRRTAIAIAGLLVAFQLLLPIPFAFIATHKAPSDVEAVDLGRPAEAVDVRTNDGLTLRGSYAPSRNGAAIVVFPGRSGPLPQARMLARNGYGVLVLDRRGEGESDGDFNSLGYGGVPDLEAAARYLRERPDVDGGRVGGLGLSVGGELMLEAAATSADLRAVVSEGAGVRSHREQLDMPDAGRWTTLPFWAVTSAATAVLGNAPIPAALTDLTPRIAPRPMFLIWATNGNAEELNVPYFEAAGPPKRRWEIPEAEHTGGLDARPAEYERRVVGFFDAALAPRR